MKKGKEEAAEKKREGRDIMRNKSAGEREGLGGSKEVSKNVHLRYVVDV
jgi:hypothetical protein